jgi:hypothetical protein
MARPEGDLAAFLRQLEGLALPLVCVLGLTVSLGICRVRASMLPGLRIGVPTSDRERPIVAGVNATLMARRSRGMSCALRGSSPMIGCTVQGMARVRSRAGSRLALGF